MRSRAPTLAAPHLGGVASRCCGRPRACHLPHNSEGTGGEPGASAGGPL
jgi:hypothetical protein